MIAHAGNGVITAEDFHCKDPLVITAICPF